MNDSIVFVDFLDINKAHRKKIYQNTNDYNKLASILNEFQMKLSSASLEVQTCVKSEECCVYMCVYTYVMYTYTWICIFISQQIFSRLCVCVCVCVCVRERKGHPSGSVS